MTSQGSSPREATILIVVGGDAAGAARLPASIDEHVVVIAADSGIDWLVAAGLPAHHVVGDLDSASSEAVDAAVLAGATIHRHPADKDVTDLGIALHLAAELAGRSASLLVIGPGGGRLDFSLGDLLAISGPGLADLDVSARFGPADVAIVRPGRPRLLTGRPAEQVSILPVHGDATGVTTAGLRWALLDADLVAGTTRALSNEFIATEASAEVSGGVVAVIQPGTTRPDIAPRTTPYDPTPRTERGTSP